ncbi:hypothetical protein [Nocardia gipuzkoensis]|uniref:hypothetical protein n=1 Tax=Nocardia gipuzkoensis TaxID=2749991 RepID=UPI00237D56F6|nr:hypothetical protein [Nocardia gipuzkoensis]MDE1671590.1 hypothetical protein [Nocardia gipuzkoensis]
MERESFDLVNGRFHVDGYPDAVKLAQLDGSNRRVMQAAALASHVQDLEFAHSAVARLIQFPDDPPIVRESLWRAAIVAYWKAFDPSSKRFRRPLKPEDIYAAGLPRDNFEHFKKLRHQVVAHNDGTFDAHSVGAVIGPSEERKVERVLLIDATILHLNEGGVNNLRLLIEHAHKWAAERLDRCCDQLADQLRTQPYESLLALPDAAITPPRI